MMTLVFRTLPAGLAAALLAACAGSSGDYPSLAIRDVERKYGSFLPTETDLPASAPIAVDRIVSPEALAALVADAQGSYARFEARKDGVAAAVSAARGLGIESDARAAALTSLSDLSSLRSATAVPLGDLDLLSAEAATRFAPGEDIDEARTRVLALVERQDAVLAELWAEMDR